MSLWDDFIGALFAGGRRVNFLISLRFWGIKENPMPPTYKWFRAEEVEGLDEEFVAKLDQARNLAGFPFVITSGFRTLTQNESLVGAVPDSAHLKGLAVDLAVSNDHEVSLIVDAAKTVGITRRGIYVNSAGTPTHVHLDVDPEKVTEVIWIKREGMLNV